MDTNSKDNDSKYQTLVDWKNAYIKLLIDELRPSGDTLEVGFGLGVSAARIQTYTPGSHTIIESDPEIAEKAQAWASKQKHVRVIQGNWKDVLPNLGSFDTIFFNDFPLRSEREILQVLGADEAAAVSAQIKTVLEGLEGVMSQIDAQFTDQEIDDFFQKIGRYHVSSMAQFLCSLKERGNISKKQYEKSKKKYHLDEEAKTSSKLNATSADTTFLFLEECLKAHMKKGCRFTSFSLEAKSKYEDPLFFDRVITNPELNYSENLVPVKTTNGESVESLVFVVEKAT